MDQPSSSKQSEEISAQERGELLRLAYRFCWNQSDAEDALHNALLVAIEKSGQLRDPAKRWPWLRRVVIQQCHLLGRKQQRKNQFQRAAGFSPRDSSAPEQTANLDKAELGELMRRLLGQLPEQQQAAMTLRHIERLEYPRIAQIMGLSESTVRAHVLAGREALRKLILSRHPEWHE
jgi:RNA polymerase sigma-70 factor (ECF subfamily)